MFPSHDIPRAGSLDRGLVTSAGFSPTNKGKFWQPGLRIFPGFWIKMSRFRLRISHLNQICSRFVFSLFTHVVCIPVLKPRNGISKFSEGLKILLESMKWGLRASCETRRLVRLPQWCSGGELPVQSQNQQVLKWISEVRRERKIDIWSRSIQQFWVESWIVIEKIRT